MNSNKTEIESLIKLLSDKDNYISNKVITRLIEIGDEASPYLQSIDTDTDDISIIEKKNYCLEKINFINFENNLMFWANNNQDNLLEGFMIIEKFIHPDIDEEMIKKIINKIKKSIWIELNPYQTAIEKIQTINNVFFDQYSFSGDKEHYYNPNTSLVSSVLQTKKGNPLSLSITYLLCIEGLGLPIFGINLPSHFVLGYEDINKTLDKISINNTQYNNILFYINTYSKGSIYNLEELNNFISQLELVSNKKFFSKCKNIDMIIRTINNLTFSYEKLNDESKKDFFQKLYDKLLKKFPF